MVENAITLTQLLQAVEMSIRLDFCEAVWVKAEIDDFSVNGNGHAYMHLIEKDGEKITARCNAHIWNSRAGYIITKFEEATERRMSKGIKVLMQCGVEFTAKFGFALNILDIDPAYTIGDMAMQREAIVKKLKEDGVFDMNRELEFPKLPQRIAVISSRTAAGYGDFMDQLHNSGYAFRVQLFQSTMQGEKTAESIIDSLNKINDNIEDFDVVVIIRGGGATADMAGFESYELAEAVCNFPLPIVTGIGHQRDTCVLDLVANKPVKTPTAVAELLIGTFETSENEIMELVGRMKDAVTNAIKAITEVQSQTETSMRIAVSDKLKKHREQLHSTTTIFISRSREMMQGRFSELNELRSIIRMWVTRNLSMAAIDKMAEDLKRMSRLCSDRDRGKVVELKNKISMIWQSKKSECVNVYGNTKMELLRSAMSQVNRLNAEYNILVQNLRQKSMLKIEKVKRDTSETENRLKIADPTEVLERGYAIVAKEGRIVRSVEDLKSGDLAKLKMKDGERTVTLN